MWSWIFVAFVWGAVLSFTDDVVVEINPKLTPKQRLKIVARVTAITVLVAMVVSGWRELS